MKNALKVLAFLVLPFTSFASDCLTNKNGLKICLGNSVVPIEGISLGGFIPTTVTRLSDNYLVER